MLFILRATPSAAGLFSLLAVAIRGAWSLYFGSLGDNFGNSGAHWGSILALRDHLRGPWDQQDGHEVVRNTTFIDFVVILGPVYPSLLISRSLKFHVVSGFVSRSLFYWSLNRKFRQVGLWIRGFRKDSIAKNNFSQKTLFYEFRGRFVVFGSSFLLFFVPWKQAWNT